jgi:hypothetical protein
MRVLYYNLICRFDVDRLLICRWRLLRSLILNSHIERAPNHAHLLRQHVKEGEDIFKSLIFSTHSYDIAYYESIVTVALSSCNHSFLTKMSYRIRFLKLQTVTYYNELTPSQLSVEHCEEITLVAFYIMSLC